MSPKEKKIRHNDLVRKDVVDDPKNARNHFNRAAGSKHHDSFHEKLTQQDPTNPFISASVSIVVIGAVITVALIVLKLLKLF